MSIIATVRPAIKSLEEKSETVRHLVDRVREVKLRMERKEIVDRPPWVFSIELTNHCPMKCVMCPRTESMTRDLGMMDFDLYRSLIDQLSDAAPKMAEGNLLWLHHFGESLEHPMFADFVNYAADKGLRPAISVNPVMLTPTITERVLSSRLDTMLISLDGHDDESFEKIRGLPKAYEKSRRNLLAFLQKKQERGWQSRVFFSMINFSLNEDSIEKAREFWMSQPGLDDFQVKPFVSWNGDSEKLVQFGAGLKKEQPRSYVVCSAPWDKVAVTWDGAVVPCGNDYNKIYVLGDLNKNTLKEIWNGPQMRALRNEFNSNKVTNPLCRNCDALHGTTTDHPTPVRAGKVPVREQAVTFQPRQGA